MVRSGEVDGDSVRVGGVGLSGTDQTFLLMAEYFARGGHLVVFAAPFNSNRACRGVKYQNHFHGLEETEVLVIPPWFQQLSELTAKFRRLRYLVVNFQCPTLGIPKEDIDRVLSGNPECRVVHIYPSQWTRQAYLFHELQNKRVPRKDLVYEVCIPNPLMPEVCFSETMRSEEQFARAMWAKEASVSMVYLACWERGGEVAERAYLRLLSEMGGRHKVTFSVLDYNRDAPRGRICDKSGVRDALERASYFVYPLVLPSGNVHKDTFACCVAEALANGVIVLTWPVAALPELYKDVVQFLPLPRGAKMEETQSAEFYYTDSSLLSEEAVDIIVDAILFFESHPKYREEVREKGMGFAQQAFSLEKVVGPQWAAALDMEIARNRA